MRFEHYQVELKLRVRQMRWEAEGVLSLQLESTDDAKLPEWHPGAHLDLILPGVITRQYSLCGQPWDRTSWRIAVLREPVSRGGSRAVHETLRPGDIVDVVGPRNNFPLDEAPHYLFIAGGIGITPILPMVENIAATSSLWSLLYGGRSRASMAFVDELERHGAAAQIRPQDEFGLLDLKAYLGEPRPDVRVYCCGPEPLLNAAQELCTSWPQGTLHLERFAARPRDAVAQGQERKFDVELARTGGTIHIPAEMGILEALEAAGMSPFNSCREGICGTCETAVLAGIPDHRDSLLSDEERAAGDTMMICVGRSLSDRLVLDL